MLPFGVVHDAPLSRLLALSPLCIAGERGENRGIRRGPYPPPKGTQEVCSIYPQRVERLFTMRTDPRKLANTWGLDPRFAGALAWFLDVLNHWGVPAEVISGRRSAEKQRAMREAWDRGDRAGLAVRPANSSLHTRGLAADVRFPLQYAPWIDYLARYAGLRWGGRFQTPDPYHLDLP